MGKSTGLIRIWYQTIKKRVKRKPWMTPKVFLLLLLTNMCADGDSLMRHPDRPFPCNDGSICYTQKEKCDGKKFCADGTDENQYINKCIVCSSPQIANAIPDKTGLLIKGEYVTYKCAKGFKKMGGDARRRCQSDRSLSGSPLVCKVPPTCKAKNVPEVCDSYFSHYPTSCTDDSNFTSKVCKFTCSSLDDCRQLKPKCTIEQTENATPDKNGQIQQGEIVTYKCNKGFFPKEGDAVRGCQRDGTLTGRKLLCKAPNYCIERRLGEKSYYQDSPVWDRFTNISTVIQSVVVKEEKSWGRKCNFRNFGFSGLGLWVKGECDAIFKVCFEEETKNCSENEKCIPKPRDGSSQGNVKQCLHKKLYCDNAYNCDDGMDENCVSFCAEHEWRCLDKRRCVNASRVCTDKEKPDCIDGSDEDPEFCFSATTTTAPSRTFCTMGNVAENTRGDYGSIIGGIIPTNNIEDCKHICMANQECGGTGTYRKVNCIFYNKAVKTRTYEHFQFSKKDCQETVCTMGNVMENTRGDYNYRIDLSQKIIQYCKQLCMADRKCGGTAYSYDGCKFYTKAVKTKIDERFVFSKKDCQETECTEDYHKWRRRMHPRKGICIHATKFCNGTGNYSKWDTEVNCRGSKCPLNFKKCADDLQCLHEDKFCDGNGDCNDRSDEQCEGQECKYGTKKCSDDKQCLCIDKFCDGKIDCVDQSDELNCGNTAVGTSARALHIVLVMVLAYLIF